MNILRPTGFDSYIGQETVKKNLKVIADKMCSVGESLLDHTLLCGPSGLGKTSLARIFVKEATGMSLKSEFIGSRISSPDVFDNFMYKYLHGQSIFIDEIHALPGKVEEALYEAMEDFTWQNKAISPFAVIGATTKEGFLSKPLHDRFTIIETLDFYIIEDLKKIIHRSSEILGIEVAGEAEEEIARRSRGTPRMANQLLKRLVNYAINNQISLVLARSALNDIGIDAYGLDRNDRAIIKALKKNGAMGLDSLASIVNEDVSTIETLREPYLVAAGFVQRTPRGRELTEEGKQKAGE